MSSRKYIHKLSYFYKGDGMLGHTQNIKKMNNVFLLHEANTPWRDVLHLAHAQKVPKGYIWGDGAAQNTFSFLESGAVRLCCHTFSSRERILLQIGSGCLFREVGLLYTGQRYSTRQEALEPCLVYNFPANLLQSHDFIRSHPELITNITNTLGAKLGAMLSLLAESVKPNPEIMVGHYLLNFAQTPEHQRSQQGISQGELALSLGLHRSTVCRVLRELREGGVIGKVNRQCIQVFDITYLQNLVES